MCFCRTRRHEKCKLWLELAVHVRTPKHAHTYAGHELATNQDVRKIGFTGSTAVGKALAAMAAGGVKVRLWVASEVCVARGGSVRGGSGALAAMAADGVKVRAGGACQTHAHLARMPLRMLACLTTRSSSLTMSACV